MILFQWYYSVSVWCGRDVERCRWWYWYQAQGIIIKENLGLDPRKADLYRLRNIQILKRQILRFILQVVVEQYTLLLVTYTWRQCVMLFFLEGNIWLFEAMINWGLWRQKLPAEVGQIKPTRLLLLLLQGSQFFTWKKVLIEVFNYKHIEYVSRRCDSCSVLTVHRRVHCCLYYMFEHDYQAYAVLMFHEPYSWF